MDALSAPAGPVTPLRWKRFPEEPVALSFRVPGAAFRLLRSFLMRPAGALLKSQVGIPAIQLAGRHIDLAAEARKARRRLYPVTILYSAYALTVITLALRSGHGALVPFVFFLLGVALWTLVEYLAHRFVLHGRFADGPGLLRRWAHQAFDHLHVEHHARPWDGNHVNGTIKDTGPYMVLFAALSFAAPLPTLPVLWATVMLSYVVEEWIHHSVHYPASYGLTGPYWRSIVRHHAYHHGARGTDLAFGLSSGCWDLVFGTRIPARAHTAMPEGLVVSRHVSGFERPGLAAAPRCAEHQPRSFSTT